MMAESDSRYKLQELLTDDDISLVFKNANQNYIDRIFTDKRYREYKNKYEHQNPYLKNVTRLTQAVRLYKKGEEPFKEAMESLLEEYQEEFKRVFVERYHFAKTIAEIINYKPNQIANIYFDFCESQKKDIPEKLFFIILKVSGTDLKEDEQAWVSLEIEKVRLERAYKEKSAEDVKAALKGQKKRIASEYKQEINGLKKQLQTSRAKYEKCLKEKEDAEKRLLILEDKLRSDKDSIQHEYQEECERIIRDKRIAAEADIQKMKDQAEIEYHDLLQRLENEANEKRKILDESYQSQLEQQKRKLEAALEEIIVQIAEQSKVRDTISDEMICMKQEKEKLTGEIKELKDAENSYFASLKNRVFEKKLDELMLERFGFIQEPARRESKDLDISNNKLGFWMVMSEMKPDRIEYGDPVNEIEDFVDDYASNLNRNFSDSTAVSAAVLAAVTGGMAVIAASSVCKYLAEGLAALVNSGDMAIFNVDDAKVNSQALISQIQEVESKVVFVRGLVDHYDEITLTRVSDYCDGKYIFFDTPSLSCLSMMSDALFHNIVVLDVEDHLQFATDEKILIGNHDLDSLVSGLNIQACKSVMKKTFNRMVDKNLIRKAIALSYSEYVQRYYEILEADVMGDIVQKAIVTACNEIDDDEKVQVLVKGGISILKAK